MATVGWFRGLQGPSSIPFAESVSTVFSVCVLFYGFVAIEFRLRRGKRS